MRFDADRDCHCIESLKSRDWSRHLVSVVPLVALAGNGHVDIVAPIGVTIGRQHAVLF